MVFVARATEAATKHKQVLRIEVPAYTSVERARDLAPAYFSNRAAKNERMSSARRSGASDAAKWPPRGISVQCTMLFDRSAKLGTDRKSFGKTATPVGVVFGISRYPAPVWLSSK